MESFKKVLPFVLIAVVLAVGGYFIGKGMTPNNQGASFYRATGERLYLPEIKPLDNPKSIVLSGTTVTSNVTESQCKGLGGHPLYDYNNNPATYWGCWVPALSILGNISINAAYFKADVTKERLPTLKVLDTPVPTLSESDCIALGGTVVCDGADYMGCMLPPGIPGVPATTTVKPTTVTPTTSTAKTR